MKRKLAEKVQEIDTLLQQSRNKKHIRRMKKGARTLAMRPIATGTGGGVPTYDPQHPYYNLDGYFSRESFFDCEFVETKESIADISRRPGHHESPLGKMMEMQQSFSRCEMNSKPRKRARLLSWNLHQARFK